MKLGHGLVAKSSKAKGETESPGSLSPLKIGETLWEGANRAIKTQFSRGHPRLIVAADMVLSVRIYKR